MTQGTAQMLNALTTSHLRICRAEGWTSRCGGCDAYTCDWTAQGALAVQPQTVPDPGEPGPCADAVSSQTVTVGGDIEMDVYYPNGDACGAVSAPYAGIAFAHGFSMFGLTHGAEDNARHGQHLASWGHVVAIPVLPDDAEERITGMREALSYIETETGRAESFLYQKADTGNLSVAARDARVKAVVALDRVYHEGGFGQGEYPKVWDHDAEAPGITAPTPVLGAPSSLCSSEADYAEIYPYVGATHKAQTLIADASHCEFAVPGGALCGSYCDGEIDPTGARAQLVQRYMTAWLNYYLRLNPGYHSFLYGSAAEADVSAGSSNTPRIRRLMDWWRRGTWEAMSWSGSCTNRRWWLGTTSIAAYLARAMQALPMRTWGGSRLRWTCR